METRTIHLSCQAAPIFLSAICLALLAGCPGQPQRITPAQTATAQAAAAMQTRQAEIDALTAVAAAATQAAANVGATQTRVAELAATKKAQLAATQTAIAEATRQTQAIATAFCGHVYHVAWSPNRRQLASVYSLHKGPVKPPDY